MAVARSAARIGRGRPLAVTRRRRPSCDLGQQWSTRAAAAPVGEAGRYAAQWTPSGSSRWSARPESNVRGAEEALASPSVAHPSEKPLKRRSPVGEVGSENSASTSSTRSSGIPAAVASTRRCWRAPRRVKWWTRAAPTWRSVCEFSEWGGRRPLRAVVGGPAEQHTAGSGLARALGPGSRSRAFASAEDQCRPPVSRSVAIVPESDAAIAIIP